MSEPADRLDLERVDRDILRHLQQDGRLTNQALAERVHAAETTSSRHRRVLESRGVIKGYAAVVDEASVGYSVSAFVLVKLRSTAPDIRKPFEDGVRGIDEVMECHSIAGEVDYLLRVVARDVRDYARVVERVESVAGPQRLQSLIVLEQTFRKPTLPP